MTLAALVLLAATLTAQYTTVDARSASNPGKAESVAPGVSCKVTYSAVGLGFLFYGKGDPSGRLVVQVRPGPRTCRVPTPPVALEIENRIGGKAKDLLAFVPNASRLKAAAEVRSDGKDGWQTYVNVPFRADMAHWPFAVGTRRPSAWFATVTVFDEAGRRTDWGTPDDPLQISWGRGPSLKEARDALFRDKELVEAYRKARGKYLDLYDHSQKERWIGYLNPGVETFAWRQADSEKLFYERRIDPIARAFDGALDQLEFKPEDPKKSRESCRYWKDPASLKLAEPAKARLFDKIADMNRAEEVIAAARRQYLCDRFMGREIAAPEPARKKPAKAASALKAPDLDGDDTGAMSLDDDELEF